MNDINWQEVAEETAKNLGWKKENKRDVWRDNSLDMMFPAEIPGEIFSWPTFGLIVEEARKMGWYLGISSGVIYFIKNAKRTKGFASQNHDNIKGACLAFNEIFKMEKTGE